MYIPQCIRNLPRRAEGTGKYEDCRRQSLNGTHHCFCGDSSQYVKTKSISWYTRSSVYLCTILGHDFPARLLCVGASHYFEGAISHPTTEICMCIPVVSIATSRNAVWIGSPCTCGHTPLEATIIPRVLYSMIEEMYCVIENMVWPC